MKRTREPPFLRKAGCLIRMHGERRVSTRSRYGFKRVDEPPPERCINQKFTPNPIIRIFIEHKSRRKLEIYRTLLISGSIAKSTQRSMRRPPGSRQCFSCSAWHSGLGWCSCCCREKRRLNRRSFRRSVLRRRSQPQLPPCPIWVSSANVSRRPARLAARLQPSSVNALSKAHARFITLSPTNAHRTGRARSGHRI